MHVMVCDGFDNYLGRNTRNVLWSSRVVKRQLTRKVIGYDIMTTTGSMPTKAYDTSRGMLTVSHDRILYRS